MTEKKPRHPSRSRGAKATEPAPPVGSTFARNMREIVESIAIAFVLAFLFRTFEAEAFVIPTGSMAPTLEGRHKDVICPQCGYRYQGSASNEDGPEVQGFRAQLASEPSSNRRRRIEQLIRSHDTVAVTCPICRFTTTVAKVRSSGLSDPREVSDTPPQPSFNGDRILVSKFAYVLAEPERWDVVVFKYPGDGNQNYIKRLVGLPGETIRIFDGDLFVKNRQAGYGERGRNDFTIERKPPNKVLSMLQLVHDTSHDPSALRKAGWPLRWSPEVGNDANDAPKWKVAEDTEGRVVKQTYSAPGGDRGTAWLRYRHFLPKMDDWIAVRQAEQLPIWSEDDRAEIAPKLITDYYAYNSNVRRGRQVATDRAIANETLQPVNFRLGLHWVGDLLLECDAVVEKSTGELVLDLVEAGKHFTCSIDLATGKAVLAIEGLDQFAPSADTPLQDTGEYQIRFGNVDDQLLLWVNGDLVDFGGESGAAEYDAEKVFGSRAAIRPKPNGGSGQPNAPAGGDLAPVGIGSRGAAVSIKNLKVFRDIYYIADAFDPHLGGPIITDLPRTHPAFRRLDVNSAYREGMINFLTNPSAWKLLASRRTVEFPLRKDEARPEGDQFFVMGDNSPSSKDARLWTDPRGADPLTGAPQKPGGAYVERRLMIGKALIVFWPHSWNQIPGVGIPCPYFPNFGDMRLIR